MTDATLSPDGAKAPEKTTTQPRSLYATDDLTKKAQCVREALSGLRHCRNLIGLFFLVVLAYSIISEGIPAFTRTVLTVEFTVTQEQFDDAESQLFKTRAYEAVFTEAMSAQFEQKNIQVPFDMPQLSGSSASREAPFASSTGQTRTSLVSRLPSNWLPHPGLMGT
jgi:phosphate transport system permease protein